MLRRHITPSLIISLLALFIATSGASYAALQIPKSSVGTKQLKTSAVTTKKVKNGSLLAKDFKSGQLPAGPAGPAGPQGKPGSDASVVAFRAEKVDNQVPLTNSLQSILSIDLPAGNYVLTARTNIFNPDIQAGTILCTIGNDVAQAMTVPGPGAIPVSQTATVALSAPSTVNLSCSESGNGTPTVAQRSITALQVGSITQG
jgi:hypothetical protein